MDELLSPKQVAAAIGASESSLKRWCDKGLLRSVKTAGGHRRIPIQEALRFVREQNLSIVEPHLLGMTATTDRKARRIEGGAERLTEALLANNEQACQAIVFEYFMAGKPVSQIFDEVIAVAFRTIGEQWQCHNVDVYEERSSCQITLRVLNELRTRQVPPDSDRIAIGATVEGDNYSLPVTMAEIVLRSVGWNAWLLGCSIPIESMIRAIEQHQPGLFWISVSHMPDEATLIAGLNMLFEAASKTSTAVAVGGRALTPEIRTQLRYSAYCDTMQHLEGFARVLYQQSNSRSTKILRRPKKV
jgi:excisionase family DNA binding protein